MLTLKKDSVAIDFKPYQGVFEQQNSDNITARLYLLVYLEILPMLEQEYQSNVADDIWSKNAYIDFMNTVAGNLTGKIKAKIASLNE